MRPDRLFLLIESMFSWQDLFCVNIISHVCLKSKVIVAMLSLHHINKRVDVGSVKTDYMRANREIKQSD